MKGWIEGNPNFLIDENNESNIYCEMYNKSVRCDKTLQLIQHINTSTYKKIVFKQVLRPLWEILRTMEQVKRKMNFIQTQRKRC